MYFMRMIHRAMGAIHLIAVGVGRLWAMVKSRCFKSQGTGSWTGFTGGADAARKRFGLEENIALPSTGLCLLLCTRQVKFLSVDHCELEMVGICFLSVPCEVLPVSVA